MSQLIEIKAKSRTGQVITLHVTEILEIDGQPLNPAADDLRVRMGMLEQRMTRVEQQFQQEHGNGGQHG